jgi:hypothetical protein
MSSMNISLCPEKIRLIKAPSAAWAELSWTAESASAKFGEMMIRTRMEQGSPSGIYAAKALRNSQRCGATHNVALGCSDSA